MIAKRIKYEYGQLVKNRPNGKRPGYRGGGGQAGGTGDMGGGSSSGSGGAADGPGDTGGEGGNNPSDGSNSQNGGNNNNNGGGADRPNMAEMTGPSPTVDMSHLGDPDPEVDVPTAQRQDTTGPTTIDPDKTTIDELITSFAPKVAEKKGFWDYTKQALGILAYLNPGTTIAKIGLAVNALDKVSTVSTLAKNLGITDKDVIASLKDNFKDGSFGGFTNTTSSINPNDRIGGDNNQGGDNQFSIVGAPEGIMKITEDMKIKKTTPTENVIGSLPNASRQDQQSMTFSPRYTRSNVANESEKGIANLKGMGESFADVFKTDTNISADGEGSSALLKEYAMLLKQMEQGLLQTEGRERLNILKSRLGLAQGGITNVNMKKNKLGEILHG